MSLRPFFFVSIGIIAIPTPFPNISSHIITPSHCFEVAQPPANDLRHYSRTTQLRWLYWILNKDSAYLLEQRFPIPPRWGVETLVILLANQLEDETNHLVLVGDVFHKRTCDNGNLRNDCKTVKQHATLFLNRKGCGRIFFGVRILYFPDFEPKNKHPALMDISLS